MTPPRSSSARCPTRASSSSATATCARRSSSRFIATILERHVFLAGFRVDALELTKGFDLFAMSSVSEGMCTALVDAMAASKAAVATSAGGIPDVLVDGETGFLVPPRDHHAMAAGIVRLLRDEPLRRRMGAAAFDRARAKFTVERMVEGTAAVYARLRTRG
jgi:glycosyltransferase involved in cell wall biosynthesis